MCLIDKKQFRIALKPIKVWKIVNPKFGYYKQPKKVNITFNGNPVYKPNITILSDPEFHPFEFEKGFFHAFTSREAAEKHLSMIRDYHKNDEQIINDLSDTKIIEGYIPFGSRYGLQSDLDKEYTGGKQICSRILILNI